MKWHLIIGLAISALCLGYMLSQVDLANLWLMIKQANPLYYLMVMAQLAWVFWLRSQRWRILLLPLKNCKVAPLWSANLIGFMANNILPARLGELVRAVTASRLADVPASSALATLVIERILDGMTLLTVLFVALIFTDPSAKAGAFDVAYLRGAGLTLLAAYLGILTLLVALWRWPQATTGWLGGLAGRISDGLGQKVAEVLGHFTQGLALLSQGHHFPLLLGQSIAIWGLTLISCYLFLPAVGLPLDPLMAAMALAGGSLAAAVPAGPGYVGTSQLAFMWVLMMAGAPEDNAAAFGVLFWAACYFPVVAAGLVEMVRRGLSLESLRHAKTE